MKSLIMGWFSFENYGATAGDLMACEVVAKWHQKGGLTFDLALDPPFEGGVNWREVEPSDYSHLVFVCGPFGEDEVTRSFLQRFAHCRKIGINLSMLEHLERWNPFDLLLERDSSEQARPDISLLCHQEKVPVIGLLLVHPQNEYKNQGRHQAANTAMEQLIRKNAMAIVTIDTRLDENQSGLRNAAEVESLIARMDLVLTTRLHGMVLAIKNGVPALAVDAINGGAKVSRQAAELGWPACLRIDFLTNADLQQAYEFCRTDEARRQAAACAQAARKVLHAQEKAFLHDLQNHRDTPH